MDKIIRVTVTMGGALFTYHEHIIDGIKKGEWISDLTWDTEQLKQFSSTVSHVADVLQNDILPNRV